MRTTARIKSILIMRELFQGGCGISLVRLTGILICRPYPDGVMAQGGYSTNIRVDEKFVFSIPDAIDSESAAPMLCAVGDAKNN